MKHLTEVKDIFQLSSVCNERVDLTLKAWMIQILTLKYKKKKPLEH